MRRSHWALSILLAMGCARPKEMPCVCGDAASDRVARRALSVHLERRLDDAAKAYDEVLRRSPSRPPTEDELERVLRFAPRVFTVASEPFELKDVAAVVHPDAPFIAYHLLWEDDIDYPDDNDPSDHEVVWVRLDAQRAALVGFTTYFHGRLLDASPRAIAEANEHGGRPRLQVQWGKHGSLPFEGEALPLPGEALTVNDKQRAAYERLSTRGRDGQGSALSRGWPTHFNGTFEAFSTFSRPVPIVERLRAPGQVRISCFNNAVLGREVIRYNFRPKTEWPPQSCEK